MGGSGVGSGGCVVYFFFWGGGGGGGGGGHPYIWRTTVCRDTH